MWFTFFFSLEIWWFGGIFFPKNLLYNSAHSFVWWKFTKKNPWFWPFFIFKFLTLKICKVFWKISWIYTLKKFLKISQLFFHKIDKISQQINYYSKPSKISINHRAKIICSELSWNHQPFHQAFKEPHVVGSSNFSHGLFSQLYTLGN